MHDDYTNEMKTYFQTFGMSKDEIKSFDFFIKLNTNNRFAVKFFDAVFSEKQMMDKYEFTTKCISVFESKNKFNLTGSDAFIEIASANQMIQKWFECGFKTIVRNF